MKPPRTWKNPTSTKLKWYNDIKIHIYLKLVIPHFINYITEQLTKVIFYHIFNIYISLSSCSKQRPSNTGVMNEEKEIRHFWDISSKLLCELSMLLSPKKLKFLHPAPHKNDIKSPKSLTHLLKLQ
jgi:hypothetical protein